MVLGVHMVCLIMKASFTQIRFNSKMQTYLFVTSPFSLHLHKDVSYISIVPTDTMKFVLHMTLCDLTTNPIEYVHVPVYARAVDEKRKCREQLAGRKIVCGLTMKWSFYLV